MEAVLAGGRSIERLYVARDGTAGLGRLLRAAREAAIPISHVTRDVLARNVGRRAGLQGVAAVVSAAVYADADAVFDAAARSAGIVLALDGITDPGNLGAVVRSAAGAGAAGIVLGTEGTVGLTPVVAKAAAGALERVPVARDARLRRRLEWAQGRGFSVVGLEARGGADWDTADLTGPLVLLAGGEGGGLRRGLRDVVDRAVTIPLGGIESLNVSVAVAVVLFESVRQRRRLGAPVGSSMPGLESAERG
jgi:23S rRNA (guanosine2251-2'-O)-methyltransferase